MSKEKKKEKLPELIKLVDDSFKIRSYQMLLSLPFSLIVLILVFFLIYLIPYFIVAPPLEQVYINLTWLAVGATFLGIIFSSLKLIERNIVESNYKSIHMCVEEKSKPLLKALILMKCKEHKFPLLMLYEKYPPLFNEENLVGRLYDLSPLSVKILGEKKIEANIKAKKEDDEKTDTNSLIAEYRVLNEAIWRRGRDSLVVNSIMITASLAIVTFAIRSRSDLGRNILFNLPNAGFVPLISLIMILIPYFLWYTTTKLDNICFDRICEIEGILQIKGNKWVLEQIRCRTWYKVRRHMWHVFYLLLIGAYLFTAYWLFRETIIV